MPATAISRATLLNQGLSAPLLMTSNESVSANSALNGNIAATDSDIVGSYKALLSDSTISILDSGLISVIGTAKSPLDLATYFINAKYADLGGASGALGMSTTAIAAAPSGAGFVRKFQHGAIYWNAQAGAHETHGAIQARWLELGGDKGFLGFPTSDVTVGNDVRAEGLFAHFQGGSIYWAPMPVITGTVNAGALATATLTTGAAPKTVSAGTASTATATATKSALTSTAALPTSAKVSDTKVVATSASSTIAASTTSSTTAKSAVGSTLATNTGTIVNSGTIISIGDSSAGAYEVHGAIREKYLALGAEASILGYPRTDETGTPDGVGRFNHFQSGSIYRTGNTYAHEVHGLVRDKWASLGWETNPQLGYPIADEMIPDPRVGHRRPETLKKPILSLPTDVVKLPADAAAAGFPSAIVNAPVATAATPKVASVAATTTAPRIAATVATKTVAAKSTTVGALGKLSDQTADVSVAAASNATTVAGATAATGTKTSVTATIDPAVLAGIALGSGPASTAGPRSVNRFADFESGVLFWYRGATSAIALSPIKATTDGTSFAFTGADVAAAAVAKIGHATFEASNVVLGSMTFVGVTPYSYDGSQTHNRRHRLQIILHGTETQTTTGLFGITSTQIVNASATVELQLEVWFDAAQRRIAMTPTDWSITQASSGTYAATVNATLRAKVDPLLWSAYELMVLPDTDNGAAIAVLSVKTMTNGAVSVFVEPHASILVTGVQEVVNSVAPSVLTFSQQK